MHLYYSINDSMNKGTHKADSDVHSNKYPGTFRIATDPGREDINFSIAHVICHQCSVLPNKENQISF